MTVNPYASPSAEVADPVLAPIPRPRRVTVAMLLLCMGAVIGITIQIILHRERFVLRSFIATGVAGGLCLAIAARRNWIRWVYAVLCALSWLHWIRFLTIVRHPPFNMLLAAMVAADVMDLAAVILLFTGPSSRWFKQPPL